MLKRRNVIVVSVMGASPALARLAAAAPGAGGGNVPYPGFPFLLELDGRARAGFRECSGLEIGSAFTPRPGAGSTAMPKLPSMDHPLSISLMRGITGDFELAKWYKASIDGTDGRSDRKNGSVIVRDGNGAEKARWNFREALPTKYFASSAAADANEMTIEILRLIFLGLEKAR